VPHTWDDCSDKTLCSPVTKGQGAVTVHAGGEQGFEDSALLMFKSGNETKLPTGHELPPDSVVIMHSALYQYSTGSCLHFSFNQDRYADVLSS
jgi:hypothetical protein